MTGLDVLFAVFALLSAAAAIMAVTRHRSVTAVWWYLTTIAALSGAVVVLGADYVAIGYLVVHVVAAGLLLIGAARTTLAEWDSAPRNGPILDGQPARAAAETEASAPGRRWASVWAPALTAGGVAGLVGGTLIATLGGTSTEVRPGQSVTEVAAELFGSATAALALLALLLLGLLVGVGALVGASRRDRGAAS